MKKQLYKVFDEFLLQTIQEFRADFGLIEYSEEVPYVVELEKDNEDLQTDELVLP